MLTEKDMEYLVYSTSRKYKVAIVMVVFCAIAVLVDAIHTIYVASKITELLCLDFGSAISLLLTGKKLTDSFSGFEVTLLSLMTTAGFKIFMFVSFSFLVRGMVSTRRRNKRLLRVLEE